MQGIIEESSRGAERACVCEKERACVCEKRQGGVLDFTPERLRLKQTRAALRSPRGSQIEEELVKEDKQRGQGCARPVVTQERLQPKECKGHRCVTTKAGR